MKDGKWKVESGKWKMRNGNYLVMFFLFFPLSTFYFPLSTCFADTLILTTGQEMKGLVLEEYVDRVVMSTYEGEKIILKNEITQILYDSEDQQLIQKGNEYRALGDDEKALDYYKKALEANPDSEPAKRLVSSTRARLDAKLQQKAHSAIQLRNTIASLSQRDLTQFETREIQAPMERLRAELGIMLKDKDGKVQIGIRYGSPASQSGFRSGDILVLMDGEPASYRTAEEVARLFLDIERTMLETTVERSVSIDMADSIRELGCQFSMEYEGLTIQSLQAGSPAEKMGLAQGDRVTEINGAATRYLPYREAMAVIEQALKTSSLTLTIQRQLWLMREAP